MKSQNSKNAPENTGSDVPMSDAPSQTPAPALPDALRHINFNLNLDFSFATTQFLANTSTSISSSTTASASLPGLSSTTSPAPAPTFNFSASAMIAASAQSQASRTFSFASAGSTSSPASTTTPTPSPTQDPLSKLNSDIDSWAREHPYVQLVIASIQKDSFSIDFTVGPQKFAFQVLFTDEWKPLCATTSVPELETYVTNANVFLEENPNMSVSEVLNLFGQFVPMEESLFAEDDHPYTQIPDKPDPDADKPPDQPTADDWDNIIIPELRKYLASENHQPYEIEEWIFRVKSHLKRIGGEIAALDMIQTDLFSGTPPPALKRFFRNRPRHFSFIRGSGPADNFLTISGTPEGTSRLKSELEKLRSFNSKELGFTASPSGRDLYHWTVKFFNFPPDSPLGQDLATFYQIHKPPTPRLRSRTEKEEDSTAPSQPKQAEIILEMKFLSDFPQSPPLFRLISPRFTFTKGRPDAIKLGSSITISTSGEYMDIDHSAPPAPVSSTPSPTTISSPAPANFASSVASPTPSDAANDKSSLLASEPTERGRSFLSASSQLETPDEGWDSNMSLVDLLLKIRHKIIEGGARVDMSSDASGLSTFGTFWRSYKCVSPETLAAPEVELGGKVLMPVSAIEEILQFEDQMPMFHMHIPGHRTLASGHQTMTFEVSTQSGKRSFCGVLEFTAPEGQICIPRWMQQNLQIKEGTVVQVRRVALPKGEFLKLQPDSADFLKLPDPKGILEWVLPNYVALAANDSIVITYEGQKHLLHVLEVKPGRAISIIDADVNLEFAPPRHGRSSDSPLSFVFGAVAPPPAKPPAPAAAPMPKGGEALGSLEPTGDQVEGRDYKLCSNCRRKIPIATHPMHSLTCARNNWYCVECDRPFPKSERDEHMKTVHAPFACDVCGDTVQVKDLANHKTNTCAGRIVQCLYCEMKLPYASRAEHEAKCGDLTNQCLTCKRFIQRRAFAAHTVECAKNPFAPTRTLPGSPPARPQLPRSDSLFFCEKCGAPFQGFDELQVHMLTTHFEDAAAEPMKVDEKQAESTTLQT